MTHADQTAGLITQLIASTFNYICQ